VSLKSVILTRDPRTRAPQRSTKGTVRTKEKETMVRKHQRRANDIKRKKKKKIVYAQAEEVITRGSGVESGETWNHKGKQKLDKEVEWAWTGEEAKIQTITKKRASVAKRSTYGWGKFERTHKKISARKERKGLGRGLQKVVGVGTSPRNNHTATFHTSCEEGGQAGQKLGRKKKNREESATHPEGSRGKKPTWATRVRGSAQEPEPHKTGKKQGRGLPEPVGGVESQRP